MQAKSGITEKIIPTCWYACWMPACWIARG